MNLPELFKLNMKDLIPSSYYKYIESFSENSYHGIRANTLKISADKLSILLGKNFETVEWCADGMYFDDFIRPAKSPYYFAGLYYIQEPSAMSAVEALDICPNDKVLDICAAPGGKSTQIGAKLNGTGLLVSNDLSATRAQALLKNITLFGIKNAIVMAESHERLEKRFDSYFDKILLDAPCSGEGMFRKDSSLIKAWNQDEVYKLAVLQKQILSSCYNMLKPGGRILYSTCTFNTAENEECIDYFLKKHYDMEILCINGKDFADGIYSNNGNAELKKCKRIFPHFAKGEGHFLSLMQKRGGKPTKENEEIKSIVSVVPKSFVDFVERYINDDNILNGNFSLHKNSLFKTTNAPLLNGLRVLSEGFYLGDIKNGSFEPSQALALGLNKDYFKNVIDFKADDINVLRYLKCESNFISGNEGYNLVCVEGFPLGFAKVSNGVFKNKYLQGWRMN